MIFPLTLKSKELNRKERILSAFDPRSAGGMHKAPGVADFNHSAISGHKHSFFPPHPCLHPAGVSVIKKPLRASV